IKLALENNAPFRETDTGGDTAFTAGKHRYYGRFNPQGDLEVVQTWIDNPVLGDMLVQTTFQDYKVYGGVRFPGRITRVANGHPVLRLTVTDVRANSVPTVTVPDAIKSYQAPPIVVTEELVEPGVWHLRGGGPHSLLVEQ